VAEEVSLDLDCFSNMFASCDAVSSSNNQILICVIFHCCDFFNCYNIKYIHVLSDENKQYI
jgi:hypothetical protein